MPQQVQVRLDLAPMMGQRVRIVVNRPVDPYGRGRRTDTIQPGNRYFGILTGYNATELTLRNGAKIPLDAVEAICPRGGHRDD